MMVTGFCGLCAKGSMLTEQAFQTIAPPDLEDLGVLGFKPTLVHTFSLISCSFLMNSAISNKGCWLV